MSSDLASIPLINSANKEVGVNYQMALSAHESIGALRRLPFSAHTEEPAGASEERALVEEHTP